MTNYTSGHQKRYLAFIAANPGCTAADVTRACKVNPNAGHAHIYDGIRRLIRRGYLRRVPPRRSSQHGGAKGLEVIAR